METYLRTTTMMIDDCHSDVSYYSADREELHGTTTRMLLSVYLRIGSVTATATSNPGPNLIPADVVVMVSVQPTPAWTLVMHTSVSFT